MFARSYHFVPSHRREYFGTVDSLGADALVFDLEDGVPSTEKSSARDALRDVLPDGQLADGIFVRINAPESIEYTRDLKLLEEFPGVGVVIPKVDGVAGPPPCLCGRPSIVLVEDFAALASLEAIIDLWRPNAIGLGFEDLFSELPYASDDLRVLSDSVRTRIALVALSRGIDAIDSSSMDLYNRGKLERECRAARSAGMSGKFTIHPAQIACVNEVFMPTPEQISQASRLLGTARAVEYNGGYVVHGDTVLSPPKVKHAETVIERVQKLGADV